MEEDKFSLGKDHSVVIILDPLDTPPSILFNPVAVVVSNSPQNQDDGRDAFVLSVSANRRMRTTKDYFYAVVFGRGMRSECLAGMLVQRKFVALLLCVCVGFLFI